MSTGPSLNSSNRNHECLIPSCHCEARRAEAISRGRLLRRFAPRNDSVDGMNHLAENAVAGASRRALLGIAAGAAFARARASAAEPAGAVESLRGECFAQQAAMRRMLAPAAPVFVGDAVATAAQSAISLHLGSDTVIRLGADTRLRIDRFLVNAGGVLTLEGGAMLYDHDAQGGVSDVTVRGPFGLIAVRGTRFFAGPSNGMFGVFVARGRVMVVGVNTAMQVTDGQGTDIARPGAEPTTPHIWAAPRITAAMAMVGQ